MTIFNKILSLSLGALMLIVPISAAGTYTWYFSAGSEQATAKLTGSAYDNTAYAETQFLAPSDVSVDINGSYTDSDGIIISPYGFVTGNEIRSSSGYALTSVTKPQGATWSSVSGLHMVYENNTPIGSYVSHLPL